MIFLIYYMSLIMYYVHGFIGMNRVTCSRLSCPYVLLKCDCTCDKMMVYVSCLGIHILYLIHEEREYKLLT